MDITSIIGILAACLTTLSFLPQAIKTIQTKDTKSLSLPMYTMFFTGVVLWFIYGIIIQDYPLLIANGITILLAGTILVMKLKHG